MADLGQGASYSVEESTTEKVLKRMPRRDSLRLVSLAQGKLTCPISDRRSESTL